MLRRFSLLLSLSSGLRARLLVLIIGLLVLVGSSIATTVLYVTNRISDEIVLDTVYNQLILTGQMTSAAFNEQANPELPLWIQKFARSTSNFSKGGCFEGS